MYAERSIIVSFKEMENNLKQYIQNFNMNSCFFSVNFIFRDNICESAHEGIFRAVQFTQCISPYCLRLIPLLRNTLTYRKQLRNVRFFSLYASLCRVSFDPCVFRKFVQFDRYRSCYTHAGVLPLCIQGNSNVVLFCDISMCNRHDLVAVL